MQTNADVSSYLINEELWNEPAGLFDLAKSINLGDHSKRS